jgi:hypothetical protein
MPPLNIPSWKQFIASLASDAEFSPPAPESQLVAVEQALGVRLQDFPRELLLEADGVTANWGCQIIWSAAELQSRNQEFRTYAGFRELYMPFDHLLFFGEDGGGDQFAFPIHADGRIHKFDVFRWDHESDARVWFASSMKDYLEKQLRNEEANS